MWVMIGHDYLNLDNIDCVRFTRDQDGTFSASCYKMCHKAQSGECPSGEHCVADACEAVS